MGRLDLHRDRQICEGVIILTDKDTFCDQVRLHERAMYSLAFSMVNNDADAAEILSEAIFRAYKKKDTLKDITAFKPWILRIVHNAAVDYIRKNTACVPLNEIELVTEDHKEQIIDTISVQDAVKSLRQPYRTVIELYYYEGFSISQISKITDSTVITVKQRLSRARKQLREILKEDFRNA